MGQWMYLFDRIFELIEADEWTFKYMEEDPQQFPLANYEWVANKVTSRSSSLNAKYKVKKRCRVSHAKFC